MTTNTPALTPVLEPLLDLACTWRHDIDRAELHNAIIGARTANWTWERVAAEVLGMILRGETPYDLRQAAASPSQPLAPWRSRTARKHP